jgi:hypothetical protein
MKLFAYYQDDYSIFSLFFIDPIDNAIIRTSVANVHGLRDLLLNGSIKRVEQDDKEHVERLFKSMEVGHNA